MEFVLDLPPPPFYTLYGPRDGTAPAATAVAPAPRDEGDQASGDAGSGGSSAAAADPAAASAASVAPALPPPPPPPTPIDGAFTVFGERHSTKEPLVPDMAGSGVDVLFKSTTKPDGTVHVDYKEEIKRLNAAVFAELRALTNGLLAGSAEECVNTVERIRVLSMNIHHLLARLRPAQAYESMADKLREQATARRKLAKALQESTAATWSLLKAKQAELQRMLDGDAEDGDGDVPMA